MRLTSLATVAAAGVALASAAYANGGGTPSLALPFAISGLGLLVAAGLMMNGIRAELVEIILGGLAGGSFGVSLAEMSAQAASIPDHYKSLWVPAVLAALLVSFLAFRSGSAP
jgi:hypothetical protein